MVTQKITDQIAEWLWTLALGDRDLSFLLRGVLARPLAAEPGMVKLVQPVEGEGPGQPAFLGNRGEKAVIERVREVRLWLVVMIRIWAKYGVPTDKEFPIPSPASLHGAVLLARADLETWQAAYEAEGGTGRFEAALLEERGEMVEVLAIDERLRWMELLTPAALIDEGHGMGNCLGSDPYALQLETGALRVFSLRDRRGRPHVSLSVGNVLECNHKGRANIKTPDKYLPAVEALAKRLGVDAHPARTADDRLDIFPTSMRFQPGTCFGYTVNWAGRLEVDLLPADIMVRGSLVVSDCPGLMALPRNLTVDEDVDARSCAGLLMVHDGLQVRRNLLLSNCENLAVLPEELDVPGVLDVSHCTSLSALPKGLSVGRNLLARGCTGLKTLPEKLHIWGDADFCYTAIESLPKKMHVAGQLEICLCKNLNEVGSDVVVEGQIVCEHGVFCGVELLRWYLKERRWLEPGQSIWMWERFGRVQDRETHEVFKLVALDLKGRLREDIGTPKKQRHRLH